MYTVCVVSKSLKTYHLEVQDPFQSPIHHSMRVEQSEQRVECSITYWGLLVKLNLLLYPVNNCRKTLNRGQYNIT